jgi:type II secretory pathway pseudopilin PulG
MGCDEWTPDDDMRRYIRDANGLLDYWRNESWLSWAAPALMPVTQAVVRQRQEEEAAERAREEARRVIEAARREEERRVNEATAKKRTAAPSKRSIKKPAPRKASKAIPIPEVTVLSDSDSDDTLGASQSKLQEYKDMWAAAKEGNIPVGYVAVSFLFLFRSDFDINHYFLRSKILVRVASRVATTIRASFATANLGASSAPTTTRDVPCSKVRVSRPPRSANGPTPVLPSNRPRQVSVPTLSFFDLY